MSATLHCSPAPFNRFFRDLWKPERANTNSYHRFRRNPNLLKAGEEKIRVLASEQVWVADITYLPTQNRVTYLSLITDAHSRKIVGHHVHDSLHTAHVSQALRMALRSRQGNSPLVHHADRGIQYCSDEYQRLHRQHGLICSMTDGYDRYQNALTERINGILKGEPLLQRHADPNQARQMVRESVEIYNS